VRELCEGVRYREKSNEVNKLTKSVRQYVRGAPAWLKKRAVQVENVRDRTDVPFCENTYKHNIAPETKDAH